MITETISALFSIIPTISDAVSRSQNLALNRDGVLIAYSNEVKSNVNLLKELNFDALKSTNISSPEFRNLIMCLQTQIGASILYDASRENNKAFIDSIQSIVVNITLENDDENSEYTIDSLLKAMQFSVDKIENLKRLAICASEGSNLFKNFWLHVRMKNIYDSLKIINEKLNQLVNARAPG